MSLAQRFARPRFMVLALASMVGLSCERAAHVSEQHALTHLEQLAKVVDDDVEQVRRGLPRGAQELGAIWDGKDSPQKDLASVRRALDHVRNTDRDLQVAKSTFFALTDAHGVTMCSDQEPERLSGVALLSAFPALGKVLAGATAETRGVLAEAAGVRTGPDEQWVAAAPVRDASGAVRGMYASGWSLRRFAYHLEETLKHDLLTAALRAGATQAKQPLVYVFVFAGPKVYGAPVTPLVNSETLEKLDLPGKTAGAQVFHAIIEITGRDYGIAGGRTPRLGSDTGVAILRSET